MSRENETYRLELEQIREFFPGKAIINRTELMSYLGKKRVWLESHGFINGIAVSWCGADN